MKKGIIKFLEHLTTESMLKLHGVPFLWQLYSKDDNLPLSELCGKLKNEESTEYIFNRALLLRYITPKQTFISLRFILNKILFGFTSSMEFKDIIELMERLDDIQKRLKKSLDIEFERDSEQKSTINIIDYYNQALGEIPKIDLENFKRILHEVNEIDKNCPNVREIFLGNKDDMSYLGIIFKINDNEPRSIVVNGSNLTFLVGAVRSLKLASIMLSIAQENQKIIEEFLIT